jgi:dethiobiotin synthetase
MGANFITGTGTDIGKTWLCCALLRHWRLQGLQPYACKPVLSGYDSATATDSDAGLLLGAMGRDLGEIDSIAPWRFTAPLSPDMAAAREGRRIDFEELVAYTRRTANADFSHFLVEGVGGVMVPLDDTHTVRDWIAASGLPAVLVAGSYLGSLSHTLTALEALAKVGAGVTAIALNESPESSVELAETAAVLARHAAVPVVSIARADPAPGVARLAGLLA